MKILFAAIRQMTDTKPSSDGHQSLRQNLGAIFGDLVLWWHFLILFF
jgi:hypothetical protein